MAKLDKEELEKLTPAERIKKLRKIEQENKKEIEEAEKLIQRTETEIEREKLTESIKVPETRSIDIGKLFEEEKESLEATVRQEAPAAEGAKEESQLYQLAQAYEEVKELYQSEEPLNERQLEWIDRLGERVEKARYETLSKDVANLVVATRSLLYKIRKYHQQESTFL